MRDLPPHNNRPGLPEIHTRVGTHGSFLGAMLDLAAGLLYGVAGGVRRIFRVLFDSAVVLLSKPAQ